MREREVNTTFELFQENFPDFQNHNNWTSKCLTEELYKRMKKLETPNGVTFDKVIQTGVDNPGHPFIMTVGCIAGDEETYDVFSEFFDLVIDGRHSGYGKDAKHVTDLDNTKLSGGDDLDSSYVLSCRVRTGRSIRGLCLPPQCTRAERRQVEKIVTNVLSSFDGEFEGISSQLEKFFSLTKTIIHFWLQYTCWRFLSNSASSKGYQSISQNELKKTTLTPM